MNLAGILAEKDDYLDVFVSDMKYSDQPITKNISEDLADIYQDIRDFISYSSWTQRDDERFTRRLPGTLRPILGPKAGEHLRALHDVKYNQTG